MKYYIVMIFFNSRTNMAQLMQIFSGYRCNHPMSGALSLRWDLEIPYERSPDSFQGTRMGQVLPIRPPSRVSDRSHRGKPSENNAIYPWRSMGSRRDAAADTTSGMNLNMIIQILQRVRIYLTPFFYSESRLSKSS